MAERNWMIVRGVRWDRMGEIWYSDLGRIEPHRQRGWMLYLGKVESDPLPFGPFKKSAGAAREAFKIALRRAKQRRPRDPKAPWPPP
jgi:hypothetical protein